jgi:arylsulfatase
MRLAGQLHKKGARRTDTNLTNAWMLAPDFKVIIEYERSIREHPNIKVGADFTGYQQK